MASSVHELRWFEPEVFSAKQAQIRSVKERLPEASVVSLAQEVLKRVTERATRLQVAPVEASKADIEALAEALISEDAEVALQQSLGLQRAGHSAEAVYLTYLGGAARLLGHWWDESKVSFVDVTVGTSRIYSIMLAMRHLFIAESPISHRSAAFASVPGETHTLGITMAAELFRKDGWDIDLKVGRTHEELVDEIGARDHRIVGLSCAGKHSITALARLIVALRISNPAARILVSGHVIDDTHDVAAAFGADAIAADLDTAREAMRRFTEST
jgi:methanogenic corrinoid protein MtbC1